MSTTNIYILRLQGGKFYVGKSENVMLRYQQHLNGVGSAWTKKYKPISLEKTIEKASPFDEDKITKEYMSKYGIENVRGGSYVEVELSDFHKEALNMEIWAAKDLCTNCGRPGHFTKNCYAIKDVSGKTIIYEDDSEDESEEEEWGCEFCERTFPTKFGCILHERSCKEKNSQKKSVIHKEDSCYRCGRPGHYAPDCYASKHIKGYYLE